MEVLNLKADLARIRGEREGLRMEVEGLKENLEISKNKNATLDSQLNTFRTRIKQLEDDADKEKERQQQEPQTASTIESAASQGQMQFVKQRMATIEKDLADLSE